MKRKDLEVGMMVAIGHHASPERWGQAFITSPVNLDWGWAGGATVRIHADSSREWCSCTDHPEGWYEISYDVPLNEIHPPKPEWLKPESGLPQSVPIEFITQDYVSLEDAKRKWAEWDEMYRQRELERNTKQQQLRKANELKQKENASKHYFVLVN